MTRGAGGGQDIEDLPLRRVSGVAAGHAEVAEDELRAEGKEEADEDEYRGDLGRSFGVHASGDLGPPEVQAAEVGHDDGADHDEVEVGDDEVGLGEVDVHAERAEEDAGAAADDEEPEEAERRRSWARRR